MGGGAEAPEAPGPLPGVTAEVDQSLCGPKPRPLPRLPPEHPKELAADQALWIEKQGTLSGSACRASCPGLLQPHSSPMSRPAWPGIPRSHSEKQRSRGRQQSQNLRQQKQTADGPKERTETRTGRRATGRSVRPSSGFLRAPGRKKQDWENPQRLDTGAQTGVQHNKGTRTPEHSRAGQGAGVPAHKAGAARPSGARGFRELPDVAVRSREGPQGDARDPGLGPIRLRRAWHARAHSPEHPQRGARLAQALAELLDAGVAQLVVTHLQLHEVLVVGQHRAHVGAARGREATGLHPGREAALGPGHAHTSGVRRPRRPRARAPQRPPSRDTRHPLPHASPARRRRS